MAGTGILAFPPPPPKVCRNISVSCSSSSSSVTTTPPPEQPSDTDTYNDNSNPKNPKKFSYSRASPSIRWPHLKTAQNYPTVNTEFAAVPPAVGDNGEVPVGTLNPEEKGGTRNVDESEDLGMNDESQEVLGRISKIRVKKINKFALKRARDWRERVQFLTARVLGLNKDQFVADVLENKIVQMTPTDYSTVVKWVGQENWQRAMEVYEWLSLQSWFPPNPRMVSTMLAILGKANQEALAEEIFLRAESSVGNTVQVYNAMMGVYGHNGRFSKVQAVLDSMREKGCQPDLVSFNTFINSRLKAGSLLPNLGMELLNEVRRAGVRPDIITYNTLLSACSRESNLEEAMKVFDDMGMSGCQPDLWTYNAMISVFARCGMSDKAEQLFKDLESKGFSPDAVTYNSLLYAFAREGNVDKVKEVCEEMVEKGFGRDKMTYNTVIHMYGKQGRHDLALNLYRDMKLSGLNPDVVTYTTLIDSLGKANMIVEASSVMSEMMDAGVKPTLRTYSALICGYARAGMRVEAEETFDCMLRSGIRPDRLAYIVMLDVFSRCNETNKATMLYSKMISDGFTPDDALYETMLRVLNRENKVDVIQEFIRDMEELCDMNPLTITSLLVKSECYDHAADMLRICVSNGYEPNHDSMLSILSSYSSSGRYLEARELLEFLGEHSESSTQLLTEGQVTVLCKASEIDDALKKYDSARDFGLFSWSCSTFESLIQGCLENERLADASLIFSDMRLYGVEPSESVIQAMVMVYCKMGFPETAEHLIILAELTGILFNNCYIYVDVVEAYGKLKLWQKAQSMVENLRQTYPNLDRKVWNALIQAHAASGSYERARAVFNTMMKDGPYPTVDSMNGLLQALITDKRMNEIFVVIEELQDMGFKISKSSILLMLDAFVQAGNIYEAKKIYHGMKAAGYFPTMHVYRIMIGLFCKGKHVKDVQAMLSDMDEAGFKPDLSVWNSMLRLYTGIEDYKKTSRVYQQIKEAGLQPNEDTYNTLIVMYCRDRRPEEGLSLMHEMRQVGLDPTPETYKSLISAFGTQQHTEQAENIFNELISKGYKLDRSFYHTMLKIYRDSGNHSKAEHLLSMMKEAGVEPSIATMHLLMLSYRSSGQPQQAEKVMDNMKETGCDLTTLPYSSVIDSYLRNGDYNVAIEKLLELKEDGLEPDHRIWICFIRGASLSQNTSEAIILLNALRDVGFDLPIRLMTEKSELLVSEVDSCLQKLKPMEDDAALNFVNALEDLLWAFERRATASWVFQLAIKRGIYPHDVFRVAEKDWGADFRKMSAGSALVALTLWLDCMQDASLQGYPEPPKSVALITGTAKYNMVSLEITVKACLWEMGSPFLPFKARSGLLVAKAHALKMWLKDSRFCLDLELKDSQSLPELNSIQLIEGCFIRRGLVPAFMDITSRLGLVRPKKFARLALMSDEEREKAIQDDIEEGKDKSSKLKSAIQKKRARIMRKIKRRNYYRENILGKSEGVAEHNDTVR